MANLGAVAKTSTFMGTVTSQGLGTGVFKTNFGKKGTTGTSKAKDVTRPTVGHVWPRQPRQ